MRALFQRRETAKPRAYHLVPCRAYTRVVTMSQQRHRRRSKSPLNQAERRAAIVEAYVSGKTLSEVGATFGITRERVRQVLLEQGVQQRHRGRPRRDRLAQRYADEILRLKLDGWSPENIASRFARDGRVLGVKRIRSIINGADDRASRKISLIRSQNVSEGGRRFSDAEMLSWLKQCAKELRRTPGTTTYDKWRGKQAQIPAAVSLCLRFQTWRNACREAGLAPNELIRPGMRRGRQFSDEKCMNAVLRVRNELGRDPTRDEYEKLRVRGAEPSAHLVRTRFPGWVAAVAKAVQQESE